MNVRFCDQKSGGSPESNDFIIPLYRMKDGRCQKDTGVVNLCEAWVRNEKTHTSQNGK